MNKDKALIIGNGVTRRRFDLKKAATEYTTFGCNGLYREFEPDYLIALDGNMINEIKNSGFPEDKLFVPDVENQYEPAIFNPNRPRENAGMLAMRYAIFKGHREIYCVGMDFLISDFELNMNNMYRNTPNYSAKTTASFQDNDNRAKYFSWFTRQFKDVTFYMLFPKGVWNFRALNTGPNVKGAEISGEYLKG